MEEISPKSEISQIPCHLFPGEMSEKGGRVGDCTQTVPMRLRVVQPGMVKM